jgi:hypothetical protein
LPEPAGIPTDYQRKRLPLEQPGAARMDERLTLLHPADLMQD